MAKRTISLLLLNNISRDVITTCSKEKAATNYCAPLGHSLWFANQLPTQVPGNNCIRRKNMNSNSTFTSSANRVLFKRDYFTVLSLNTLKMKRCADKGAQMCGV